MRQFEVSIALREYEVEAIKNKEGWRGKSEERTVTEFIEKLISSEVARLVAANPGVVEAFFVKQAEQFADKMNVLQKEEEVDLSEDEIAAPLIFPVSPEDKSVNDAPVYPE